jgi:hypothetical protein
MSNLWAWASFGALTAIYGACWVPSFDATVRLTERGNKDSNDEHVAPPSFVLYAILIIFALFLLFPAAFAVNLARGIPETIEQLMGREKWYTLASMIAKVSLHAVIGFAVIGQSAALDTITTKGNRTTAKEMRSDEDTLTSIVASVAGATVFLTVLTRYTLKPCDCLRLKQEGVAPLKRLHAVAGCVHLISASAILTSALIEDSTLKRYAADYSQSLLEPGEWVRRCYNKTSNTLDPQPSAKCPGDDLFDVFTNKYRGEGPLNIAVMAFAFAAWSGILHIAAACMISSEQAVEDTAKTLMRCRWGDYIVSAPLMLSTLNVIFAATNIYGVFLAPALLALLEALSWLLEHYSFDSKPTFNPLLANFLSQTKETAL